MLSIGQQKALETLKTSHNVFLSGEAGAGKSYVIREFSKSIDIKKFPLLASTGAAAVLIGGRTFHSFMGLGIMEGGVAATVERALRDRRLVKRLNGIQGFILDEVSMISAPTLEAAERICARARGNPVDAWGGLRAIVVGDFAQLPPVQMGSQNHQWAFDSATWENSDFKSAYLPQNMRIEDTDFLSVLNMIRRGKVDVAVEDFLNSRLSNDDESEGTRLFPRRAQADAYNNHELSKIDGKLFTSPSIYSGKERFVESLKKNSPLPDELNLKLNCRVMLRQNDPKMRWVNGSQGILKEILADSLIVELTNGTWAEIEKVSYSLLDVEGSPVATVINYPVILSYAATIHKAQGMTLDRLHVDLSSLWEPGHAYVAISRVRRGEDLIVQKWNKSSIRSDARVMKFYEKIKKDSFTEEKLLDPNVPL